VQCCLGVPGRGDWVKKGQQQQFPRFSPFRFFFTDTPDNTLNVETHQKTAWTLNWPSSLRLVQIDHRIILLFPPLFIRSPVAQGPLTETRSSKHRPIHDHLDPSPLICIRIGPAVLLTSSPSLPNDWCTLYRRQVERAGTNLHPQISTRPPLRYLGKSNPDPALSALFLSPLGALKHPRLPVSPSVPCPFFPPDP
jgi:hypothetical protein